MRVQVSEELLHAGFWVGDWFVEPLLNRISRDGETLQVEPKIMEVLLCLARHPGKTVTKEHFLEEVWADTVVTDDVLSRCISELRKMFGDDSRDPRFIETIRKTGYRLIAPVSFQQLGPDLVVGPKEAVPRAISLAGLLGLLRRSVAEWVRRRLFRPVAWGVVAGAFLVLTGGYLWVRHGARSDRTTSPTTIPLTSFPGQEVDPAFSPDGDHVAFAWDNDTGRDFDIYIKQVGTETPLRITDEREDERHPAWSPDGLHLAFVRSTRDDHAVFVIPSIGGSGRKVADFGAREIRGLAWSPDGRTLAVSARRAPYQGYSLFLALMDGAAVKQLTAPPVYAEGDLEPAFSPDGKQLAFIRSLVQERKGVFVMDLNEAEPRQLTADSLNITGLAWTADGQDLVFASQYGGTSGLWRVAASGGAPKPIDKASEGPSFHHLSVARQGARLTYAQRSSNANIWRLWRSENAPTYRAHPFIFSTRWDTSPQISPDGNRIAFASSRSGTYEIWMCGRDGGDPVQLTSFGRAFTGTPRWSPDGTRISFVSRWEGKAEIYVIDAEGGALRRLSSSPSEDLAPAWSRDGKEIYFASNRSGTWQIWKMPEAGGEAVQVTAMGGWAALEAPDGASLYFVKPDAPGIWQIPTASEPGSDGSERRIIDALEPSDWGNWAVENEGIYFVRREENAPVLAFYAFATEETTRVATLKNVPEAPSFSAAPGGDWFLYTQVDLSESDILLMESFR